MLFTAGDRVVVRGERWVVEEATTFAGTTLLSLSAADCQISQRRCRLLLPFDRPVAADRNPRIRAVTARRWMRQLHAQVAGLRAYGELRAPRRAAINIHPFQLEPALALVRGHASRFLLADEVGLGKTIQAGLMLAELRQRGWCEHALIVTPAGLRQQWADELLQRFDVRAAIIEAASLAALADSLPFDVNPWTVDPVAITSIDFLKQPEVLHGLTSQLWDVLIVDEAHQATIASLRYDAVNALAKRARHVMLLTATPHAGDDHAYRALCAIGEVTPLDDARGRPLDCARDRDDPILLFRRTRELAGLPRSRRAHLLPIKPTPDSVEMHRLLDRYLAQLWKIARDSGKRDVQLVAMVLAKRAFSSSRSLVISLERRMAGLTLRHGSGQAGEIEEPLQSMLPLGFEDDPSDDALLPIVPAFERVDEERAVLQGVIDAARRASADERKMHALKRLVRRVREPLIIFTEYRDTLDAIAGAIGGVRRIATLHGGQSPEARRHSLAQFTSGTADVMIATDAGSEGLNLQNNCRLVVNLELPWNPIRLEQRIGRVDRIGQTRTVHAINLFADGTAERTVLSNLLRRIDRIRMSEIEIAACVIGRSEPVSRPVAGETHTKTIDLGSDARAEAVRIAGTRGSDAVGANLPEDVVPVTLLKSPRASLITFFRVRLVTHAGRLVEDTLVPVCVPIHNAGMHMTRREVRALGESLTSFIGPELMSHVKAHADRRARSIAGDAAESIARAIRRERAIAMSAATNGPRFVQAGLFDSRALKQKWHGQEWRDAISQESEAHANQLETDASVILAHDPQMVMLLILSRGGPSAPLQAAPLAGPLCPAPLRGVGLC
jgi:superfamily II DNA or RNA helicase